MKRLNDHLCRREFLRNAARTTAALGLAAGMLPVDQPLAAGEESSLPGSRISYFCNGEIHVNQVGKPEGKPLTTGHMDFKPSWSKTGNMLVCFRRTKDDPVTVNWKSAIFVINADGSGFHQLTDGSRTDFNPTWTRDGRNTPIWNRKNDKTGSFFVMQGKVGNKPGQEVALTEEGYHTWAHSCLRDGRILVNSNHPKLGWGVFLMTRREGAKPLYERVQCELASKGQLHRASVSPSEKEVCFEFLVGSKFTEPGHTLYIADFDAQQRTITNLKVFANEAGKRIWFAYPRWIAGEDAVVYHSGETGKNQLYVYRLKDGSTKRVSTSATADYRYPHGEAAPC
jgi:Tol biopolymer transport system component